MFALAQGNTKMAVGVAVAKFLAIIALTVLCQ